MLMGLVILEMPYAWVLQKDELPFWGVFRVSVPLELPALPCLGAGTREQVH